MTVLLARLRRHRRPLLAAALLGGLIALVAIGLGVVYPRVGAWYIRTKSVPRLAERLGRDVTVGSIEVRLGHATLRDVRISGAADGAAPLARLERVDIDFDTVASLYGTARVRDIAIRGGAVSIHRDRAGHSNLEQLGTSKPSTRPGGSTTGGAPIHWRGLTLDVVDLADGLRGSATELRGSRRGGVSELVIEGAAATTDDGPTVSVATIELSRAGDKTEATIAGGELSVWTGLKLTGIHGTIGLAPEPGRLAVFLAGGYGGVDGTLWNARGWVEPRAATGEIRLKADELSLDRLRPILEHSVLVDYPKTVVDIDLTLARNGPIGRLHGGFHVRDLTVAHAMVAEQPVRIESMSGDVELTYDRSTRTYTLLRGDFGTRGLPFQLTGQASLGRGEVAPKLAARFVVPTVGCQQVLDALPPQLTAEMANYQLAGSFATDLHLAIDWANLQATELRGSVGINGCRTRKVAPSMERLKGTFEHFVEVERGEWLSFLVGPENPDFVPLAEVSPYLLLSLQTTEDGAFYKHHGFLPREFRTALIRNLEARRFKYGASSITMQTVKNVLLYRQKTLARKFQELFLTWAIERYLDKDRIFEIYVNAIEYGPGLYGIGPAAQEYFGKPARDLTAKEAAFFSSILPNPKERYRQYCKGTLRRWTEDKIGRILDKMLERNRLTQAEYDEAIAQPLVFVKSGAETEDECNRRVARALRNARPTNPLAPR